MPFDLSPEFKHELSTEITGLLAGDNAPGAVVGLVGDDGLAWELSYGFSDLESGRKPDRDTIFRIASITKTFTATTIFQLRDAGTLSLDSSVDEHIPELKSAPGLNGRSQEITVRRLLSHTSGLNSYTPVGRPYFTENKPPDRDEALSNLSLAEFVVEPGGTYRYSNFGFALLGELITRVSDEPYERYVLDHICGPLGLNSTKFTLDSDDSQRAASGYVSTKHSSELTPAKFSYLGFDSAAGQLHSSLNDLSVWLQFHLAADQQGDDSAVLSKRSRLEMRMPQNLSPDWNGGICMNWLADKLGDFVVFRHGGGIPGFSLEVSIVPEQRFGVVSLVNASGMEAPVSRTVIERVANLPGPVPEPAIPTLAAEPPDDMVDYLGVYMVEQTLLRVEWHSGALWVRPEDQLDRMSGLRLEPTGKPDEFIIPGGRFRGDRTTFERSDSGKISGYVSGAFRAVRLGEVN